MNQISLIINLESYKQNLGERISLAEYLSKIIGLFMYGSPTQSNISALFLISCLYRVYSKANSNK